MDVFTWKEFISFDPRGADAYLKIDRTFEALDGHKGSVVVPMAVYPWDKGGKITISDFRTDLVGKDLTLLENTIEYSEIYSQSDTGSDNVIGVKVNAKVVEAFKLNQSGKSAEDINSILPTSKTFTSSFDRHDYSKYEVDSLLNLKIAHRFQFKMPISFLRSNMSEGIINESFFLGKVKVYWAVVSDQYDPITNKDISLFKGHLLQVLCFKLVLNKIEAGARHPRNNQSWPKVGIFAQRGKNRPNRLGVTTVKILKREGRQLLVQGLNAIDGTPVLDIKPVIKEFLPREEIRQPVWATELMKNYW